MYTIFDGDLTTFRGRLLAWLDMLFIDHGIFRLGFANLAIVAPGRLYRCNHPTPRRLSQLSRRYGLKTLINLRGKTSETGYGSTALTREMASRLGLVFIDMSISGHNAPTKAEILRCHAVMREMTPPALIHCKSGSDRAGFVAAMFLLFEGAKVDLARRHLSLRYGHVAHSRAGILDAFLLSYKREGEGRKGFIDWVREDYDEEVLARDFRPRRLNYFIADKLLGQE